MHTHTHSPQVHYLNDYQPSPFLLDNVLLHFDLHEKNTHVTAILQVRRNPAFTQGRPPLILDGEKMQLKRILLDGDELLSSRYQVNDHHLTVFDVGDTFMLETTVEIQPQENKQLTGLYKSGAIFCTQCESRGFRRITYFLDRPDVLTRFTTTITADKTKYPILLSNGDLTDSHELQEDRHWVKWEDPTLKPCYLFALVAGDLDVLTDTFITQSGRSVQLAVYVEPGKREQAEYAMASLQEAMRWDEKKYGREYDLNTYMVVGVSDFNFGAMENKGLNIFNDKYILARPETATDDDFIHIQAVIGHEYFHNWSGNRVTVRDWFQITLKEGLTVFRESQFTADKTSPTVKRINEVKTIRSSQFAQDAGPMAHPIYPDSYIEINNFYTVTVYEKGAEVIRMLHTLLGPTLFRQAMDLYFSRYDGQPVTVDEFIKPMAEISKLDLTQFRHWYKQAGTPEVMVKDDYDPHTHIYTVTLTQTCPPTPGQPVKEPFHIPFAIGLLDDQGRDLPLQLANESAEQAQTTRVLSVQEPQQTFTFINIPVRPTPSLLRNFSAPVKLDYPYTEEQLVFLMSHDNDLFNRWDAGQQLAERVLLRLIENYEQEIELPIPHSFLTALSKVFEAGGDEALLAEMLTLPSETYLIQRMPIANVDAIHDVRQWLKKHIALALKSPFLTYYEQHSDSGIYQLDTKAMAKRRLKNLVLHYLACLGDTKARAFCTQQFKQSNNMTDTMGAIEALNAIDCEERTELLSIFYHRWHQENLVVDKWLALQAISPLPNTLAVVKSLTQHPSFVLHNPNRVRALIGTFATSNPVCFHTLTGDGYAFLADYVLKIDHFNPQLAARILEPLTRWRKFDPTRQSLMRAQLQRIAEQKPLSNDVYEVVSKSLS